MGDVTVTDARQGPSKRQGKKSSASKPGATGKRKLDEMESEAEVASEAPTGDRPTDDDQMSELSWLDDSGPLAESTPKAAVKPPKKKAREDVDSLVISSEHMVNATHLGASKSNLPAGGPAGASSTFQMVGDNDNDNDDYNSDGVGDNAFADWLGVLSQPAALKAFATSRSTSSWPEARSLSSKSQAVNPSSRAPSSSTSSSQPLKVVARPVRPANAPPLRTKAMAPPAFARPPRPSQNQPFQPNEGPVGGRTKGRKSARKTIGAVESDDDEEPERHAAISSPPKGGARPTSSHVVKIKQEQPSPRPAKLSINVMEPTPRKIEQVSKKSVNKNRGNAEKGKQKAQNEDSDSSEVEIVEDAPQTLKPPRSANESRSRSRSHSRSASVSRSSKSWRFEDLPEGSQQRWKSDVMPILLRFQGAQRNPWTWAGPSSVRAMQVIWDAIYADDIPHEVVSGDCVHGFAGQCLSNWRSAIRAASETVVGSFFQDIASALTRTKEGRADFSNGILQNYRYLYEKPFDEENKRLFRSKFFLTILGWHLEATKGAADIPGLFIKPSKPDHPIGAFGLGAAALERIFMLFGNGLMAPPLGKDGKPSEGGLWHVVPHLNPQTGVVSTSQTRFTERCFSPRTTFFIGRVEKMAAHRLNAVLADAQAYMGPKRMVIKDTFLSIMDDSNNEPEDALEDGDSE